MRLDIGQGEYAPKVLWVLFDATNGNPDSRRYIWYFKTRKAALAHKREQQTRKHAAQLVGPVRYHQKESPHVR